MRLICAPCVCEFGDCEQVNNQRWLILSRRQLAGMRRGCKSIPRFVSTSTSSPSYSFPSSSSSSSLNSADSSKAGLTLTHSNQLNWWFEAGGCNLNLNLVAGCGRDLKLARSLAEEKQSSLLHLFSLRAECKGKRIGKEANGGQIAQGFCSESRPMLVPSRSCVAALREGVAALCVSEHTFMLLLWEKLCVCVFAAAQPNSPKQRFACRIRRGESFIILCACIVFSRRRHNYLG